MTQKFTLNVNGKTHTVDADPDMPLLYALGFLWLDILLVGRNSPLLSAAKLFMFFSIPSMYSPFLFLLYGGAVVLALACYVILVRRGAFTIVGLRV